MSDTTSRERSTWPERVKKAVWGSVVLGYGLAVAGFIVGFVNNEFSTSKAVMHGLVVFVLIAVPPTTAMLSLRGRPLMLLPAGVMGVASMYGGLSVFGFPLAILGGIWLWAYLKMTPDRRWLVKTSMLLVPLLWLGASVALWAHLDPACEQRLRDGTVIEVDPASHGFESGWFWEVGSTASGSSGSMSDDVVFGTCSSNILVPWEALAAIAMSAGAVLVAYRLARPVTDPAREPINSSTRLSEDGGRDEN